MAAIGSRLLTLTVGATEYAMQVTSCTIEAEDSDADTVTFSEAAAGGGRRYTLHLTFLQDAVTTTLWDKVWTLSGTDVATLVRPYGNAAASATQPHYSGTVTISEPDGVLLGGDADPSTTNRFLTEVVWVYTAKPTKVIA